MPKQKTHKGAAKRFRVTAGGKVMRHHSMANHIMTKKSTKRKRKLRKATTVKGIFSRAVRGLLHG